MSYDNRPVGTDNKSGADVRTAVVYKGEGFTASGAEAMVTLQRMAAGVNSGGTASSFVVPNGKRFVPQQLVVITRNAGAAIQAVTVRLRINTTGATTTASPAMMAAACGTQIATAAAAAMGVVDLSDSWPSTFEIVGDGTATIGISQTGTATAGNDVYLIGYEY